MNSHSYKPSTSADKYISIVFIAVITACSALSLNGLRIDQETISTSDLLNGTAAQSLESHYDQHFALKQLGTNSWGALEYHLFSEGRQGVVVGNSGWLFTNEEFQTSHSPYSNQQSLQKNLAYINWVAQKLTAEQVHLLVVPVPAKARLYSEYAGKQQPNSAHRELYQSFAQTLSKTGIRSINTLALMEQQKGKQKKPLFLRTDTHWSPEGAQLVAREVSHQLSDIELPTSTFITEKVDEKNHRGDLTRFLPLSPWFDQLMPTADTLSVYRTYAMEDALFGDEDSTPAVALVGTSYSAGPQWNFEGALKQHLNTQLSNYAQAAQGPLVPMSAFLEKQLHNLPELKVVIWEIPERYLLVAYPQVYSKLKAEKIKAAQMNTTHRTTVAVSQ